MLLQIIVAVVAAGGALAFGMRRKIKALFKKKDKEVNIAAPNTESDIVDMMADNGNGE